MRLKKKKKNFKIQDELNLIMKNSMNLYNKNIFYEIYLKYYYRKFDWYKKLKHEIKLIEFKKIDDATKINIYKFSINNFLFILLKNDEKIGYLYSYSNHIEELFIKLEFIDKKYSKYLMKYFLLNQQNLNFKSFTIFTTNLTKSYKIFKKNKDKLKYKIIKKTKTFHITQYVLRFDVKIFLNQLFDIHLY